MTCRLLSRIEPLRRAVIETYELARAALAAIADTTAGKRARGADDAEPGDKTALDYLELMDEAISQDLATPRLLAILQETLRDQEITPMTCASSSPRPTPCSAFASTTSTRPPWSAVAPPPTWTRPRSRRSSA